MTLTKGIHIGTAIFLFVAMNGMIHMYAAPWAIVVVGLLGILNMSFAYWVDEK